jgi:hypothetical protein
MNWQKPSINNYPPFKQIVLGLQLPNKVDLVKLDRIDESGPVFQRVQGRGLLSEFADLLGNDDSIISVKESTKIDMYCIIELPETKDGNDGKKK